MSLIERIVYTFGFVAGKHFLRALFPGFEDVPPTFMVLLKLFLSVRMSLCCIDCLSLSLPICLS